MSFTWHFERQLDGQCRVPCPAEWRPSDPNFAFMLVIWPHRETKREAAYIKGLTQQKYRELQAKVAAMPLGSPTTEALRRAVFRNAIKLKLDQAGRFCLPKEMCELVGLKKEVYFDGNGDQFGIWNPAQYEECVSAEKHLAADAYDRI